MEKYRGLSAREERDCEGVNSNKLETLQRHIVKMARRSSVEDLMARRTDSDSGSPYDELGANVVKHDMTLLQLK